MTDTPLPPWKFERVIDGIPCVPTVEAEHNMQAYATKARADLEVKNARLRDALAALHDRHNMENMARAAHALRDTAMESKS